MIIHLHNFFANLHNGVLFEGQGGGGGGRVAIHLTNEKLSFGGSLQAYGGGSGSYGKDGNPGNYDDQFLC